MILSQRVAIQMKAIEYYSHVTLFSKPCLGTVRGTTCRLEP